MKKLLLPLFTALTTIGMNAQCTLGSTVADVTLQCSGGTQNRTGVAFNPLQNLYYSVDAGSSSYPIETFSVTGGPALSSTSQGADYRGYWWNPTSGMPEGNTFNGSGVYSNSLTASTYYANSTTTYMNPAPMPNSQLQGHADLANNLMIYYYSGTIYKYNKTTGSLISSVSISGLPSSTSNLNTYGCAYTGLVGAEVALYNYVNQCIYFINYSTGAYVTTCTLPASAPTPSTYRVGFANGRFFIYDSGNNYWYGYPVLNPASSPTVVATASSPSVCAGGTVALSASGANTYTWSTGTASANIVVTPTTNITYTVVGTNTAGCAGTGTVAMIVNPGASVTANASPSVICSGFSTNLNASGVNTYTWSNSATGASVQVSPANTTTYSVLGTNNLGCVTAASIVVNVNPLPVLTATVTPTLLCVGSTATLTSQGAVTFTWDSGANTASTTESPVSNAVYSVSGTSTAGCISTIQVPVIVNSNTMSISPDMSLCLGASATLSVSSVVTQTWSNGSPFSNITVTPAVTTSYSVSGNDIYGCLLSNSVNLTVNPVPVVTITASKTKVCKGEPVNLVASGASTYSWSNNSTASSLTVSHSVNVTYNYSVVGTNTDGCSASAAISIVVNSCNGLQEAMAEHLYVYPVPCSNVLHVPDGQSLESVQVIDELGKAVLQPSAGGDIDVSQLPKGVYLLRAQSGGQTVHARFLKE